MYDKCSDTTNWLEGKRFSTSTVQSDISDWIQSINIDSQKTGKFNFNTRTVMLNSGYEMPINGLGTYAFTVTSVSILSNLLCQAVYDSLIPLQHMEMRKKLGKLFVKQSMKEL